MPILICSTVDSLRERWRRILGDRYQVSETASADALQISAEQKTWDLLIVHRSVSDMVFLAELQGRSYMVLADVPEDNEAIAVLRRGALAYGNSYMSPSNLREAVQAALTGHVWLSTVLLQKIIKGTKASVEMNPELSAAIAALSERELEVAQLVAHGRSNGKIAEALNIAERTVKAHISAIFKKTGAASRLRLALLMKGNP